MISTIQSTGGLRRWIVSLFLIAVVLAITFFAVTAFFPGSGYIERLGAAYVVLWSNTTQRQFTDIMRDTPWLYIVPAVGLIFVLGWQLPRRFWGRAVFTYVVFIVGFVGGHVFW